MLRPYRSRQINARTIMKKSLLLIIALAGIALSAILCGAQSASAEKINDGKTEVKKSFKIGKFNKIDAQQAIRIEFTQGESDGYAHVRTSAALAPYLEVYVKNGCLVARYKNKNGVNVNGRSNTVVRVSSRDLKNIELSSAASFNTQQLTLSSPLTLDCNSASALRITSLICQKLEADMSSSASLYIEHFQGEADLDASSAASVAIDKLYSNKASLDASSAGSLKVKSFQGDVLDVESSSGSGITVDGIQCNHIYAEASSGGSIRLSGSCVSIDKETSSGGSVKTSRLSKSSDNYRVNSNVKKNKNKKVKSSGNLRVP